jgi:hypothetical protein
MYAKFLYHKKKGTLPEWRTVDGACDMCGNEYNTMPHAEEYGPTFEDYLRSIHILCGRCHGMLHLRYRFPKKWKEYLDYIKSLNKGEVERLPNISNMNVLYQESKKWEQEDYDYQEKKRGKWWEKISTKKE